MKKLRGYFRGWRAGASSEEKKIAMKKSVVDYNNQVLRKKFQRIIRAQVEGSTDTEMDDSDHRSSLEQDFANAETVERKDFLEKYVNSAPTTRSERERTLRDPIMKTKVNVERSGQNPGEGLIRDKEHGGKKMAQRQAEQHILLPHSIEIDEEGTEGSEERKFSVSLSQGKGMHKANATSPDVDRDRQTEVKPTQLHEHSGVPSDGQKNQRVVIQGRGVQLRNLQVLNPKSSRLSPVSSFSLRHIAKTQTNNELENLRQMTLGVIPETLEVYGADERETRTITGLLRSARTEDQLFDVVEAVSRRHKLPRVPSDLASVITEESIGDDSTQPDDESPEPDDQSPDNDSLQPDDEPPPSANESPKLDNKSPQPGNESPQADNKSPKRDYESPQADNKSTERGYESPQPDDEQLATALWDEDLSKAWVLFKAKPTRRYAYGEVILTELTAGRIHIPGWKRFKKGEK